MPVPDAVFVDPGGTQTFAQPLLLDGMRFWGFLFEADEAALQATVDRYLNQPARGAVEYHVLCPRVLLGIADFKKATVPANAPKQFTIAETDVAFWVPLVAIKRVAGIPFAERLVWFMPYVFVNNSWAIATGREVYGFPKEWSIFQIPANLTDPALFTVDTLAVKQWGPDAPATLQRLFEVRRVDSNGGTDVTGKKWNAGRELLVDLLDLLFGSAPHRTLPGLGLVVEAVKLLALDEYPLAFLKQFRDVADGTRACYQAIVEAPARITKFSGGGFLQGDYVLTIQPFESHPIVQDMGLKGLQQPALVGGYVEFDFIMENGKEMWKA